MRSCVLLLLVMGYIQVAWAGLPIESSFQKKGLGGSIQAGGVVNTGNSENKNFHGKLTLDYYHYRWHDIFSTEGQLNSASQGTTSENVTTRLETRYGLTPKSYLFAKGRATYDRFSTFDRVYSDAIGYGRVLHEDSKSLLTFEGGPGGSHARIAGSKEYQNQAILNLDANYSRKISDSAKFTQALNIDLGSFNTHTRSVSAITTKINHSLSLQLSYTVEHDSKTPMASTNRQRMDTISQISIIYTLGKSDD